MAGCKRAGMAVNELNLSLIKMLSCNPRIDAYIENAADFAKPILEHLRALIHEACPFVEEHMKWSMPGFGYKGLFCGFAAYKHYCRFGFWKASLIDDPYGLLQATGSFMGEFGKILSIKTFRKTSSLYSTCMKRCG